jgi:SAM-dependent methyltransferase
MPMNPSSTANLEPPFSLPPPTAATLAPAESAWPDADWFVGMGLSAYETDFCVTEYGRGLDYYLARLDRLMLSGERVLDAGCGVGQWALALSHRYAQVDAVDIHAERLTTLRAVAALTEADNIHIQPAAIDALPFENDTFDAVFCYGVIMFTPMRHSLAELYRVLKPGGRLYVCLNADGWYHMLLATRSDPALCSYMRHILAKTYLAQQAGVAITPETFAPYAAACQALKQQHQRFGRDVWKIVAKLPYAADWLARQLGKNSALAVCLAPRLASAGQAAWLHLGHQALVVFAQTGCTEGDKLFWSLMTALQLNPLVAPDSPFATAMPEPLQKRLRDLDPSRLADNTRAYAPSDLQNLLDAAGYVDYQHAPEGHLVCDVTSPHAAPIYDSYYQGSLMVWEALATKPAVNPDWITPKDHIAAAMVVRDSLSWFSETPQPVLSNASVSNTAQDLLARAQRQAKALGGPRHLRALVAQLTHQAQTDEDRLVALVTFVQRSLFHHPVVQPLFPTGGLPEDSAVILLTHLGRCGHAAQLLVDLLTLADIQAERVQLANHVSVRALVQGRWLLAEADCFKNGILPRNAQGALLSWDDICEHPTRLDCVPPTGWFMRPGTRFTQDAWGQPVGGYVDAFAFEKRGYVSGVFASSSQGAPPSVPQITSFGVTGDTYTLSWTPATHHDADDVVYRVSIGTTSRGWSYNHPGDHDEICQPPVADVAEVETSACQITGPVPAETEHLYAAVTAVSRARLLIEPDTYFWPSDEVSWERGR